MPWQPGDPIRDGGEYVESLRGRDLDVWLFGKRIAEPVDHPIIRPSINAIAATYDLAVADPGLAAATSELTGEGVNRFLHITGSADDVVSQNKMQRRLGRETGTCFQRCVGMDAVNALFSLTYDIDAAHGTGYHHRFTTWLAEMQRLNLMVGGAMTDVKGDRSKGPLGQADPDLASATSELTGKTVNRFLHVTGSAADVVSQNRMQRRLGRETGTCFQRCVGMDAVNALFSLTYDIDAEHGTDYHRRFTTWLTEMQRLNVVIGGAMTDVKGDRSKGPLGQADPDLYLHVSERRDDGVVIRGAKAHQTGAINSHWMLVMPTARLGPEDRDYAIVGALPVEAPGITYIYGRQSSDTRSMEGQLDVGNAQFAGQEALVVFDDVFIPTERVFMDGETEFAAELVERFTSYHRRSYVCKSGVGDVLIGAAALIADYNGVPKASHIRDKLVEMSHLNETIYGLGIAASHESTQRPAGNWEPDPLLANSCKLDVTRYPYELGRLAQDLAGGAVVTLPSEQDFDHPDLGPVLEKYFQGRPGVPTRDRVKVFRLIENMTMGRNAVGYLTESLHGAGSPQAQRIVIERGSDIDGKKRLAERLAGIGEDD